MLSDKYVYDTLAALQKKFIYKKVYIHLVL